MMDVVVVAVKNAYSLSKRMPVIEWHEEKTSIDCLSFPDNFYVRMVNVDLLDKKIDDEFKEFKFNWQLKKQVEDIVFQHFSRDSGIIDMAVFIEQCKIALIFMRNTANNDMCRSYAYKIVNAMTIDEVKKELSNGQQQSAEVF